MVLKELTDIMQFTAGKNVTRLKALNEKDIYKPDDFEENLHGDNTDKEISGCIINLIYSKAAPFFKGINKDSITSNFLLCSFDEKILDPWYFCYMFNESKEIQQQINMLHQGNTLSVKKLTIKNIGEVKIRLPDLKKQKIIGELYKECVRKTYLMEKQSKNISKLMKEIIQKIEED